MPRQCQRPDCAEPASVSYSFDPSRQLVLLDHIRTGADAEGAMLCYRHAGTMVLPKGWWLDDRRQAVPTLFANLKRDLDAKRAQTRRTRTSSRAPAPG